MPDEKDKEPRQHPEDGAATPGPAAVPRGKQKDKQKGEKPAEGQKAAPAEPEGPPPEPAPPARLHEYYGQKVRPRLAQQFGLKNPHEIPKLVKIVLNVGMGDARKNPKGREAAVAELAAITGQQPVVTRSTIFTSFGISCGFFRPNCCASLGRTFCAKYSCSRGGGAGSGGGPWGSAGAPF